MPRKDEIIVAIEASKKHWTEDLLQPIKEGRKITISSMRWKDTGEPIPVAADDCALCNLFYESCISCPLSKIGEKCNLNNNNPYRAFRDNPCEATAQAMVDALDECLRKEKEEG